MDITRLFSGEMSFSLSDLDRMQKDGTLTKGNIVASNFGFGNLDDINHVFSTLLHLDFLDYIHKLNDINQTRYVLDGHPILIDYAKLKEAYRMRNEIVHGLKNPKISNWGILSMWDNIMNIMDISGSIFLSAADKDLRSSLDADYQWGIEREKKKRIYQLYSEQIINLLTEKGQIQLLQDGKLNNLFLDGIRVKNDDDILTDNINWIIRKMLRRKLIRILNNNVSLAPIGINRSKKLQKSSNTLSKKGH
jgi:hypothetical protein